MKNNFIHLYLLSLTFVVCWARGVPTSVNESKAKVNCPSYLQNNVEVPCWTLGFNAKCYCFSATKRLDWRRANEFCRGGGMVLLGLETFEEDMLISNHIKGTSSPNLLDDYYWTSGRYSQEGRNRWEWATVEPYQPMTYTNWYPGLPNNNLPGSFAYVNYLFDTGIWFDMANTTSILFICESIDGSTTTTSTTGSLTTAEPPTTESPTTEPPPTTGPPTTDPPTTYRPPTTEPPTTEPPTTEPPTTEPSTTERPTTEYSTVKK
ncbi:gamete and mating-type specific protein A-like [Daphnia carinata]|uniref:gamete and mating-type specific protein A-like n=1 Tax=Daphnia carinata TaxID=120202 RepID=UPI00257D46E4|nr:gamete and mating-type specific protein A-like [Daphnia carinata]